jgi:acetoacetyl-CoA synthetase
VALTYNGATVDDTVLWDAFTSERGDLVAEPVPFDHPLCVLFSSGTTGLPKAIVHGHGGIVLEAYKNHALSWDLGSGDRLMWFTTTAWMMWNALVSTLLTGASIVCLDGNPMWPDLDAQWRIAEEVRPTMMGLGPAFVMTCVKQGKQPAATYDLTSFKMLCAAGSPMPTEGFVWLHEQFGSHAPTYVGSGGTDVCTGLIQGYPIVPVYAGELSAKCLGVAAFAFDDDGNSIVGELGELVIIEPMPSMPVGFWGDDDDMSRYRAAYFEHYPGVMRFGDWVRFTERGTGVITGRSDATLNRGGVRIGTAEIYRVVEQLAEIDDSLVVHLEDPSGGLGELILFVQLATAGDDPADLIELDSELRMKIAAAVREALSPRHVPDAILAVSGVPRNLTGKKLEIPVKQVLRGVDVDTVVSRQAMADPSALDSILDAIARR